MQNQHVLDIYTCKRSLYDKHKRQVSELKTNSFKYNFQPFLHPDLNLRES